MATNVGKNRDILRRQRKKDGGFGRFFAFKPRGFVRGADKNVRSPCVNSGF